MSAPALGCKHYKRSVKLFAPCCNKAYVCRFCHDDQESHSLNTRSVRAIICLVCDTKQDIRGKCTNCCTNFGNAYSCLKCRLFDHEFKHQYHCEDCGCCRVGPRENYFHCDRCNLCLNIGLKNNHKCIDNVSRDSCPICLEDLHRSVHILFLSTCGHCLHKECYDLMAEKGQQKCPLCGDPMMSKLDQINGMIKSMRV